MEEYSILYYMDYKCYGCYMKDNDNDNVRELNILDIEQYLDIH
jgi:hypothetical protein